MTLNSYRNMSAIWTLFTKVNENNDKANCNTCKKDYTCKGGTTSSLINHLQTKHKEQHKLYMENTKGRVTNKRPADPEKNSKEPNIKQKKLEDCFSNSDENLNKAISDAVVDFLADSGVAFCVVGLESFKKLMNIANRRIKLKSPRTYSRMVQVKAKEIKQEIIEILEAVKGDISCIGFTTDLWTSNAGNLFMSLSVHLIDKNWVLHRWTPYVKPFPARHTGRNISLGLDAMVEELGLTEQNWELYSVNDNTSNVKLGIKL